MRRLLVPLAIALVCLGCVVTVRRGGRGKVVVHQSEVEGAEVVASAAALAAALAGPLQRLEASLGRWRDCLGARRCSAEEFLRTTESDLLGTLEAPELAALRDWAQEGFREAREDFAAAATPGPRPASLRREDEDDLVGLFEKVLELVSGPREMAEKNALLTDLCVVSKPVDGAWFELWPSSQPERTKGRATAGELVNVYRGLYAFRVERQGYPTIVCDVRGGGRSCPRLDLVEDPQPVFECDLRAGRCSRQPGPAEACDGGR